MSDKIKAYFGADVSDVEAGMLKAQRATKAYERAVREVAKVDAGEGLVRNLSKTNSLFGEISRKFTGGKILESVLGGVGLGGGFQIAQTAASFIAKYWEDAANSAKAIADYSDKTTDLFLQRIKLRETDEQALAKAKRNAESANRALVTDTGDDEVRSAELRMEFQKAALELETLQKKQREKQADAERQALAEKKRREDEDHELFLARHERQAQAEENAQDAKRKDAEKTANFIRKLQEDEQKRQDEMMQREAEAQKEIDQMKYDRAWRFASDEEKIAQVRKEGRAAQRAYDEEASAENLLALEKAKSKWMDLRSEIMGTQKAAKTGSGSDPLATGGRERGADGKLRRKGAVISEEDAARTDITKARNEQGKGGQDPVAKNTADLLKELQSITSKLK